jgi:hypothetical protein
MRRFVSLLFLAGWLIPAAGCAITVDPADFPVEVPSVPASVNGPISVESTTRPNATFNFNFGVMDLPVDLNAFSARLAALVADSLRARGADLSGGRTMRLQVDYVAFMVPSHCLLDYRVYLGDAAPFGLQSTGDSRLFDRACGTAFASAVRAILTDPRTTAFLEGS